VDRSEHPGAHDPRHDRLPAETLPAAEIEKVSAVVQQREAKGNPPDELFDLHCRNLRRIHDAGMVIGLGTDGTGDGIGVHQQMAAYTRCGMTAMEAIVAGTGTNARLLKLDRMGIVATTKEASFIVLDANPLDDIANTLRMAAVLRQRKRSRSQGAEEPVPGRWRLSNGYQPRRIAPDTSVSP
jgi:hypothetical protein